MLFSNIMDDDVAVKMQAGDISFCQKNLVIIFKLPLLQSRWAECYQISDREEKIAIMVWSYE